MNLTYIIGLVFALAVMVFGMVTKTVDNKIMVEMTQIGRFFDASSVLIVIGCTIGVVVASFPGKMLAAIPKHFGIILNTKKYKTHTYIDQLVELAQIARKNGLLALEEKANEQKDPFFKQAIMLIVDANDPDKVRDILNNDIEAMSARHESVAGMYDKASAVAPAFGMVGTLIGLINMLKNMNLSDGSSNIGSDMGTALITTLYGCILAHVIFGPVATGLRTRDEQEVLCKMLIVEGIISIQSGENPKFLKDRLLTYLDQKQREAESKGDSKGGGSGESAA